MRNYFKLGLFLAVGLVSLAGLFLTVPGVASAATTPCFNCMPNDRETFTLKNRSTGDSSWHDPVSAHPGQRIGLNVYYHIDACNFTGENVRIKIVYPKTNLSQITSYAYIEADNVDSKMDTGTINVTGGATQLIFDETAYWYPDRS